MCTAGAVEVQGDEFWDYDQQTDLEAFSAPTLYDILSRQCREVTRDLGKQKEEVRDVHVERLLHYIILLFQTNLCYLIIAL